MTVWNAAFGGTDRLALFMVRACASTVLAMLPSPACAIEFDVKSQRADYAITEFAQQAGISVLFPMADLSGVTSMGLRGDYGIVEGFRLLLRGTGFIAEVDTIGRAIVRKLEREEALMVDEECVTAGCTPAALAVGMQNVYAREQPHSVAALELETVTITARRREEGALTVPGSIAVLSETALRDHNVQDISDISELLPNVSFQNATNGNRGTTSIYIRGVGSASGRGGGALDSSGSAVYLDGRYLPNRVGQMMSTLDVERVEILRGPQGTLFGRNTTGGLINVISAKPKQEFGASLALRAAEFGEYGVRAMLNVPLTDSLAARLSVARETSDGYYFNRTFGRDWGATDLEAVSAALRFRPNNQWAVDLAFRGNYQDDDNTGGQCRALPTPDLAARFPGYAGPTGSSGVGVWGVGPGGRGNLEFLYDNATIDYWASCATDNAQGDFVMSSDLETFSRLDNEFFTGSVAWAAPGQVLGVDNMKVQLSGATQVTEQNFLQDRDFSALPIHGIGTANPDGSRGNFRKSNQIELLLSGDMAERFHVTLGANYFDDFFGAGEGNCLDALLQNFAALSNPAGTTSVACQPDGGTQFIWLADKTGTGGPAVTGRSGQITSESWAAFGHLTYDVTEKLKVDLGARYTVDKRKVLQTELLTTGGCTYRQPGDGPRTALCQPRYILSYNNVFGQGVFSDLEETWDAVTPMASLTYQFNGNQMAYALYSRGFLSGSFNDELRVRDFPALANLAVFDPEFVDNFEIGAKGHFLDGRLSLVAAAFYMDYSDKHEAIRLDNPNGAFGTEPVIGIIDNAGSVAIKGVELEARATPWRGGAVSLDFGYLKSEYSEFNSLSPVNPNQIVDLSSTKIGDFTPDWSLNASVQHTFVLPGRVGSVTPQLGVAWQGAYEWLDTLNGQAITVDTPPSFCHQDSYSTLRGRVSYMSDRRRWEVSAYGINMTDTRYFDMCGFSAVTRQGVYSYTYGRPRTFGLEFIMRFGDGA